MVEHMRVRAWGGVSALNAIISGYGSSMAVSLPVDVTVDLGDENKIVAAGSSLIEEIIRLLGTNNKFRIRVDSQIPAGMGLKSSSAVSAAVALALIALIDDKYDVDRAVRISAAASKNLKVSITGAHDDAYASLLGGIVLTSNEEGRLISRHSIEDKMEVLIGIPRNDRKRINVESLRSLKELGIELKKMIEEGKWMQAMTINGMLVAVANGYDASPAIGAVKEGAIAAGISGNGPAYFCLVKPGWGIPGSFEGLKVIRTVPENSGYII
ncbi:MAG: shikimate kinase [Nitrososphaeria archaeon]